MPKGYPNNRIAALARRSASLLAAAAKRKEEIPPIMRFWQKVSIQENGCWLWDAGISNHGYSEFSLDGKMIKGHQFAYEHFRGSIPEGLEPDHLCRNRACVNPWHMELVVHIENCNRGEVGKHNRDKTHCPHGHLYDESNTYYAPGVTNRQCRICKRENKRKYRDRKLGEPIKEAKVGNSTGTIVGSQKGDGPIFHDADTLLPVLSTTQKGVQAFKKRLKGEGVDVEDIKVVEVEIVEKKK
jgi:hypothetical protein